MNEKHPMPLNHSPSMMGPEPMSSIDAGCLDGRWVIKIVPRSRGAKNITMPGLTHDELRTHPEAITTYLNYLLSIP